MSSFVLSKLSSRFGWVRARRAGRGLAAALVVSALTALSVVLAGPASAAALTGVIKSVTVTPTNPGVNDLITTHLSYCVPNGTQAGDTFSLTLPSQMTGFPLKFAITDASGGVVATASVVPGPPAVATFTMTSYAQTHNVGNVCGTAKITSHLGNSSYAGQTITLTYTDNGGQTFTNPITVKPVTATNHGHARKNGLFTTGDQCTSVAKDCITWRLLTPLGPWTSGTYTDKATAGQSFDCATVVVQIGTATGTNGSFNNPKPYSATVTCSTTSLKVTYGAVPANSLLRITFKASAGPDPNGGASYPNTAQSTAVNSSTKTTTTDTVKATLTSSSGGGNANGDAITINKYSTADGPIAGAFDDAPGKAVAANTPIPISMLITNTGTDALKNVTVTDATASGPVLTGLSCDFSKLGGPATGTTWAGPFAIGASFLCTGTIPPLTAGVQETDTASVIGTGVDSDQPVSADNPFNSHTPAPAVTINKYSTADGSTAGAFDTAPGKSVAAGTPGAHHDADHQHRHRRAQGRHGQRRDDVRSGAHRAAAATSPSSAARRPAPPGPAHSPSARRSPAPAPCRQCRSALRRPTPRPSPAPA